MWFLKGEEPLVDSSSPGKSKLLLYGAVVWPLGKVITQQVDRFSQGNTISFTGKVRRKLKWLRIDLVWDNARWHIGRKVEEILNKLRIHEHRLPPYSPKMKGAEPLIRWSNEVISDNSCWVALKQVIPSGGVHSFPGQKDCRGS